VGHEGKKSLLVVDPTGTGPATMNWPCGFAGFADQIGNAIGAPALELLTAGFSNSTNNDIMASQITLMDAMQSYFEYEMLGGCGIPWMELQGTVDDWHALRAKAAGLRAFDVGDLTATAGGRMAAYGYKTTLKGGLGVWLDALLPVLDKLAEAAGGAPDADFFGAVCNVSGGSGSVGEPITGWVSVFYPFDCDGNATKGEGWREVFEHTRAAGGADDALATATARKRGGLIFSGITLDKIPTGLSQAPVSLTVIGLPTVWPLRFIAGPTTMHQVAQDGALEVRCGWAVCETTK
jgi:hypothetical protein